MRRTLPASFSPRDVIDVHVHIAGPAGENEQMYFVSPAFKRSLSFEAIKLVTKLPGDKITGPRYVSVLFSQVHESRHVDKAVLLALDAVYGEDGQLRREATHLYVANDYCAGLARIYPVFLFGCSVHPYAPDGLERLWRCARDGAVLCKWLPSAQCIDPTHPLAVRFYRALALLGMPLLIHVGPEETIPTELDTADELLFNAAAGRYGERPGDGVALALEQGATVIVAHSATPLGPVFDPHNDYWEQVFDSLLERIPLRGCLGLLLARQIRLCGKGVALGQEATPPLSLWQRLPHPGGLVSQEGAGRAVGRLWLAGWKSTACE